MIKSTATNMPKESIKKREYPVLLVYNQAVVLAETSGEGTVVYASDDSVNKVGSFIELCSGDFDQCQPFKGTLTLKN